MSDPQSAPPFISIVIPAKNEEKFLPSCLQALQAQRYPRGRFEVIVVDNGSSDRTLELARQGADLVLECPGILIGAMRNRGVARARGTVLSFIDADCLADPSWLHAIAEVLQREPCVTGADCFLEPDAGWIAETWYCYQQRSPMPVTCLATNNLSVPREVFDTIAGFDETLRTGEDCEFCARARAHVPVIADPGIRVIHRGVPKTLRQFFRREIWHGLGAWGTFRHRTIDKPLIATLVFAAAVVTLVVGLVAGLLGVATWFPAGLGLLGVFMTVSGSVFYRRQYVRSLWHAVRWGFLYVIYFGGRTIALLRFLVPRDFYHHMRTGTAG